MKNDTYEEITNRIIDAMTSDHKWESGISGIAKDMPRNARGNYYSGINILLLWMSSGQQGFTSNVWMTYKQASEKGAQVRKGEKGTGIIFYKMLDKKSDTGEVTGRVPLLRTYTVFNTDQIDGLPEAAPVAEFEWDAIEAGERLLKSSVCEVVTENVTPCYIPSRDMIKLPAREQFHTAENYYATLAHEMGHSTGHKTRLDRLEDKSRRGYAYEELIAELSAVFTCSRLGIDGHTENHASYLKSWLKAMESDKKYIFQAATAASKATEWLLDRITAESDQVEVA